MKQYDVAVGLGGDAISEKGKCVMMNPPKNNSDPVGIAVIGCGHWGPNHIRNFSHLPNCHVTAVDLDERRLERVARSFPNVTLQRDYRCVLADEQIDAVIVCTPTSTHFDCVKDALQAGKHVLCEKPLCMVESEAEELVKFATARRLSLMTGHVFLFNPGIEKVKELVDKDELGELQYLVAVRTNLGPIRTDVNAAFDLATHDISIFNWILGAEPEVVSATGEAFVHSDNHDVVFLTLRYPQHRIASIHASWLSPKKVRQISVVGTRRMLTWDDLDLNTPVAIYDRGANALPDYNDYGEFLRISMWDGDVRMPKVTGREPLRVQAEYFLDAIQHGGPARSNSQFSLGVVRVLDAAQQSLKENGAPITLSAKK